MQIVLQVFVFLMLPALLLWAEKRVKFVATVSPVVLCYALGIVLGNQNLWVLRDDISKHLAEGMVALAIPLLLFPTNLATLLKLARPVAISYGLAIIAVIVATTLAVVFWGRDLPDDAWLVSAMLAGVFTGGTPNMAAISVALQAPQELFVLVNTAEMVLGGFYFLFLLTLAKPLFAKLLPAFVGDRGGIDAAVQQASPFRLLRDNFLALLLSASLVGVALGTSMFIFGRESAPLIILTLTSLAIVCSLLPPVNALLGVFEFGQYLLLVFCLAVGSMAGIDALLGALTSVFGYVAFVLLTSIVLHFLLAKWLGIDYETLMITSTAAIYGPPFIGPIGAVLKNRNLVAGGIAAGVVGLAIGTYLGVAMGWLLKP